MKSLGMMNCTGIKVCTLSLSLEKGIQKYTCKRRGVKFPTYGQRSQPKGLKIHPPTWVHMLKFGFQTIFPGKSTQWPSKLSCFKLPGLLQKNKLFLLLCFSPLPAMKKTQIRLIIWVPTSYNFKLDLVHCVSQPLSCKWHYSFDLLEEYLIFWILHPKQIWPVFEEDWQAQTQANFLHNFLWSICGRKLRRTYLCYIMFCTGRFCTRTLFSCFQV